MINAIGNIIGRSVSGAENFNEVYQVLLAQSITSNYKRPSVSQQTAQNNLLVSLQNAGILDVTDVLHVKATNGSPRFAALNWVNPATNEAILGYVNHYWNQGFRANDNGVNNFIDENWLPSNGVNFTQNSAEIIVYYKEITTGVFSDGSRTASGSHHAAVNPHSAVTQADGRINSLTNSPQTDAQFDGTNDIYFFGRLNATTEFVRKGSSTRVTFANNSSGRSAFSFTSGALNTAGTKGSYNTRMQVLFWAGGLLTTGQEDTFKSAIDTYLTAIAADTETILGTVYDVSSWADLTDFVTNGATAVVVANDIDFSGGAGTFTQTLDVDRYTSLERWEMTALITVGTNVSNSFGFGIGTRSVSSGGKYNLCARMDMTTGAGSGKTMINAGSANTQVAINNTQLVYSVGDQIELKLTRLYDLVTVTLRNVTTASATITTTYRYTAASPYQPNTSRFAIYSLGGSFTLNSLTITSNEVVGAKFMCIGDSKTQRYNATPHNARYPFMLSQYVGQMVVNAGGDDRTADVLNKVPEIIELDPEVVILEIGSNDVRNSVPSGTYLANYDAITSALETAGIRVVHCTGIAESVINQDPKRTHILATYDTADIIDTLPESFTLDADGVHLTNAGMLQLAQFLAVSGKL